MWPFKCKEEPVTKIMIPDNPFIARFPIGSEFEYMGVKMSVIGHWAINGWCSYPQLHAEYVDLKGGFQMKAFNQNMFERLSRDNLVTESETNKDDA